MTQLNVVAYRRRHCWNVDVIDDDIICMNWMNWWCVMMRLKFSSSLAETSLQIVDVVDALFLLKQVQVVDGDRWILLLNLCSWRDFDMDDSSSVSSRHEWHVRFLTCCNIFDDKFSNVCYDYWLIQITFHAGLSDGCCGSYFVSILLSTSSMLLAVFLFHYHSFLLTDCHIYH